MQRITVRLFLLHCLAAHRYTLMGLKLQYTTNWPLKPRPNFASGNVVYGPTVLSSSNTQGIIASYEEAVAGPKNVAVGGYVPIVITAQSAGDYYIQFEKIANINGNNYIKYFDVTVLAAQSDQVLAGRL